MKSAPLGEIATIERRGVEPSSLPSDTRYLGLEHIERGGRIICSDTVGQAALASTKFAFTPEHVLYGKLRPNLGKVSRPTFAGVCSTDILPIRPGPSLDRDFLAHYLSQPTMIDYAASRTSGANLPRLSPTVLGTFEIPIPPLDEQRRIAEILDHADENRVKRRQMVAHLEELGQAIFAEMFGSEPAESFIPVSEVCDRITVGVVIKPASHYVATGVPALRTLNVKPGWIDQSELVYFSEESNDGPLAKSKLRVGDVVVSRTGRAGVAAVVPPYLDGANAIDLIVVSPTSGALDSLYFEALLNSPFGVRLVAGEQRGQIQQHFNVGSLKTAQIPVPPLSRQKQFADKLRRTRVLHGQATYALAELDDLFSALRFRAFSGQL